MLGAAARLLLLIPLCYILPGPRVLEQVEVARKKQPAVHVVAALKGIESTWPERVEADVHPVYGARFEDGRGGRWVLRGGEAVASSSGTLPAWVPPLEPIAIRTRDQLQNWLSSEGIDWQINELGRCGAEDCFVLGGRDGRAQLWLEKDRLEVRRVVSRTGTIAQFDEYRDFGGVRFPARIALSDADGDVAVWTVQDAKPFPASQLGQPDFSSRWTGR